MVKEGIRFGFRLRYGDLEDLIPTVNFVSLSESTREGLVEVQNIGVCLYLRVPKPLL